MLMLLASVSVNVWIVARRTKPGISRRFAARSNILMGGIRGVRELAAVRQPFQSIVTYRNSGSLLGFSLPGTSRKFILKYSGTLVCGCDLTDARISECFAVNRVRIFVPRAKVMDAYADMSSVEVYDQSAGIFTSVGLNEQNEQIAADVEKVRENALTSGVLRHADDNTRMVLTSLAASLGMEAEVIFDERPPVKDRETHQPEKSESTPAPLAVLPIDTMEVVSK
jgi:hypothetical protein